MVAGKKQAPDWAAVNAAMAAVGQNMAALLIELAERVRAAFDLHLPVIQRAFYSLQENHRSDPGSIHELLAPGADCPFCPVAAEAVTEDV